MEVRGKVAVITGAGSGIGAGLARRFAAEGAAYVVLADVDVSAAHAVVESIRAGGSSESAEEGVEAVGVDITRPAEVEELVRRVVARFGRLDIFCSNAGIATGTGLDGPLEQWQRTIDVNVMGHLHSARAAVPALLESGGYLVFTASAAGLLTAPGDAAYSVSKHAVVALAEWIAIEYAGAGLKVSALCPMGVATPLLLDPLAAGEQFAVATAASGDVLPVDDVAGAVIDGLRAERFLILPHPQVGRYWSQKAADVDRWIAAMSAGFTASQPGPRGGPDD